MERLCTDNDEQVVGPTPFPRSGLDNHVLWITDQKIVATSSQSNLVKSCSILSLSKTDVSYGPSVGRTANRGGGLDRGSDFNDGAIDQIARGTSRRCIS